MKKLNEFLEDYCCDGIIVNCNDTFGYACSESTDIDLADLPKLREMEDKYGHSGVVAFCAKIKGCEPIKPYLTEEYEKAKKELESYKLFEEIEVKEVDEFLKRYKLEE